MSVASDHCTFFPAAKKWFTPILENGECLKEKVKYNRRNLADAKYHSVQMHFYSWWKKVRMETGSRCFPAKEWSNMLHIGDFNNVTLAIRGEKNESDNG